MSDRGAADKEGAVRAHGLWAAWPLLAVVLSACGGDSSSAGVPGAFGATEIRSVWRRTGYEPVLDWAATLQADVSESGEVVVADETRVVRFGADGDPVSSFGTRGRGPGEFDDIVSLAVTPGQGVVVIDRGNRRTSVWSHDSLVAEAAFPLTGPVQLLRTPLGVFLVHRDASSLESSRVRVQAVDLANAVIDGALLEMVTEPRGRNDGTTTCSTCPMVVLGDGSVVTDPGTGQGTLIRIDRMGAVTEWAGFPVPPPYGEEEWRRRELAEWDAFGREVWRLGLRPLEGSPPPRDAPPRPWAVEDGMAVDGEDRVWLLTSSPPGTDAVIAGVDRKGAYLGTFRLEGRMGATWLRLNGEWLLLGGTDERGVPWIELCTIRPPSPIAAETE